MPSLRPVCGPLGACDRICTFMEGVVLCVRTRRPTHSYRGCLQNSCDSAHSKATALPEFAMARTRDIVFDGHSDLSMRCHAQGGQSDIEVVSFWDSNTRQVSVFSMPFTSLSLSTTNLPTDSTSLALTLTRMSQSPEIMCTS